MGEIKKILESQIKPSKLASDFTIGQLYFDSKNPKFLVLEKIGKKDLEFRVKDE